MNEQALALDYFRKLISFLYREVGVLRPDNHLELYKKSKMKSTGFSTARKARTKYLYWQTISRDSAEEILKPYYEDTGLSLDDVYRIFSEGDWLLERPKYYYGGPKWASIAEATIRLRNAIISKRWAQAGELVREIENLEHNNGRIVDKFKELG